MNWDSMNKLAKVTVFFWIMKICATTLGETAGDLLSMTMNVGYAVSSLLLIGLFLISVVAQLKSTTFHPVLYWTVILTTSTAGTTMSDYMDRTLGLGYARGSLILIGCLLVVLSAWRISEKTLSVSNIRTTKAELFYWTAILFSNTLGTALGDFLADDSDLGFLGSAALIGGVLGLVVLATYFTRLNRVVLFWIAFVLTRPFGATFGDLLTKPVIKGGLNFGTIGSSLILASLLATFIIYTSMRERHVLNQGVPVTRAAGRFMLGRNKKTTHMPLREDFESTGNWLFRWRSYLPLLLIGIVILALRGFEYPGHSKRLDGLWEVVCLLISFVGLGIRAITIGHTPKGTSGRNTIEQQAESLNTTGMYSVVRHPLYLGNLFMGLGIALFAHMWSVTLIYVLAFCVYYERIMYAEEAYLRERFGNVFVEWASRTPAFIPNFKSWKQPSLPFSLRNVLRREYSGIFALIVTLFVLEVVGDIFAEHRLELDLPWELFLILGFVVWAVLRTLKKKTTLLNVEGR